MSACRWYNIVQKEIEMTMTDNDLWRRWGQTHTMFYHNDTIRLKKARKRGTKLRGQPMAHEMKGQEMAKNKVDVGQQSRVQESLDVGINTIQTTRHTDEAWLMHNHKEMPNGSQDTFIDQQRCQWQTRYWSREEDHKDSRDVIAWTIKQQPGTVR